ncbi:MAG TPA: hypothetical protein PKH94_00925 [Bacteroidales bacterium]|nr:hypothetical protein [Bacteroidales bacterium]
MFYCSIADCRSLVTEFLGTGCRLATGYRLPATGYWLPATDKARYG